MIWLFRGLLALAVLGWVVGLAKIERRRRNPVWSLGPDSEPAPDTCSVSVIIPARNEVGNLGPCLDAVLAQDHPALEVVVLDDASTDGTTDVLRSRAAEDERIKPVFGGDEPPDGWFGKPWALERAQREARGDWLVFVDADVRLHRTAISRIVGYGEREGVGMVSGIGRLVMETFWERVMQPAVAGLILAGNDLDEVNDPDKPDKVMANGQLIAVRRTAYEALGRHEAVQGAVIEDVAIAKAAVGAEQGYRFLLLRELFECRMYTSFGEIWQGWSKNLFAGMHYSWGILFAVLVWLVVQVLSGPLLLGLGAFGILSEEWLWWGAILTVLMQGVRLRMDLIWGLPPLYGITHAPATLGVMGILLNSGIQHIRGGVAWKGRMVR
ncbi:MAG: glycosyltransferase family 2 protein [Myxococcota bacterium]|nr:glycosyltransferase family 2 protein [Myxococcota bacterium]